MSQTSSSSSLLLDSLIETFVVVVAGSKNVSNINSGGGDVVVVATAAADSLDGSSSSSSSSPASSLYVRLPTSASLGLRNTLIAVCVVCVAVSIAMGVIYYCYRRRSSSSLPSTSSSHPTNGNGEGEGEGGGYGVEEVVGVDKSGDKKGDVVADGLLSSVPAGAPHHQHATGMVILPTAAAAAVDADVEKFVGKTPLAFECGGGLDGDATPIAACNNYYSSSFSSLPSSFGSDEVGLAAKENPGPLRRQSPNTAEHTFDLKRFIRQLATIIWPPRFAYIVSVLLILMFIILFFGGFYYDSFRKVPRMHVFLLGYSSFPANATGSSSSSSIGGGGGFMNHSDVIGGGDGSASAVNSSSSSTFLRLALEQMSYVPATGTHRNAIINNGGGGGDGGSSGDFSIFDAGSTIGAGDCHLFRSVSASSSSASLHLFSSFSLSSFPSPSAFYARAECRADGSALLSLSTSYWGCVAAAAGAGAVVDVVESSDSNATITSSTTTTPTTTSSTVVRFALDTFGHAAALPPLLRELLGFSSSIGSSSSSSSSATGSEYFSIRCYTAETAQNLIATLKKRVATATSSRVGVDDHGDDTNNGGGQVTAVLTASPAATDVYNFRDAATTSSSSTSVVYHRGSSRFVFEGGSAVSGGDAITAKPSSWLSQTFSFSLVHVNGSDAVAGADVSSLPVRLFGIAGSPFDFASAPSFSFAVRVRFAADTFGFVLAVSDNWSVRTEKEENGTSVQHAVNQSSASSLINSSSSSSSYSYSHSYDFPILDRALGVMRGRLNYYDRRHLRRGVGDAFGGMQGGASSEWRLQIGLFADAASDRLSLVFLEPSAEGGEGTTDDDNYDDASSVADDLLGSSSSRSGDVVEAQWGRAAVRGSRLFDGRPHDLVVVFDTSGGSESGGSMVARLFVDGYSDSSDRGWSVCVPDRVAKARGGGGGGLSSSSSGAGNGLSPLSEIGKFAYVVGSASSPSEGSDANTNTTHDIVLSGGVMHIGYFLPIRRWAAASLEVSTGGAAATEVGIPRVYGEALDHAAVLAVIDPLLQREGVVDTAKSRVLGYCLLGAAIAGAFFAVALLLKKVFFTQTIHGDVGVGVLLSAASSSAAIPTSAAPTQAIRAVGGGAKSAIPIFDFLLPVLYVMQNMALYVNSIEWPVPSGLQWIVALSSVDIGLTLPRLGPLVMPALQFVGAAVLLAGLYVILRGDDTLFHACRRGKMGDLPAVGPDARALPFELRAVVAGGGGGGGGPLVASDGVVIERCRTAAGSKATHHSCTAAAAACEISPAGEEAIPTVKKCCSDGGEGDEKGGANAVAGAAGDDDYDKGRVSCQGGIALDITSSSTASSSSSASSFISLNARDVLSAINAKMDTLGGEPLSTIDTRHVVPMYVPSSPSAAADDGGAVAACARRGRKKAAGGDEGEGGEKGEDGNQPDSPVSNIEVVARSRCECPTHRLLLVQSVLPLHESLYSADDGLSPYGCIFSDPEMDGLAALDHAIPPCPGISSGAFFVCPVDACGYAVCASCFDVPILKVKGVIGSYWYSLKRSGPVPYVGALVVVLVQSVQQPAVTSALRLLNCDRSFWCYFPTCYSTTAAEDEGGGGSKSISFVFVASAVVSLIVILLLAVVMPAYIGRRLLNRQRQILLEKRAALEEETADEGVVMGDGQQQQQYCDEDEHSNVVPLNGVHKRKKNEPSTSRSTLPHRQGSGIVATAVTVMLQWLWCSHGAGGRSSSSWCCFRGSKRRLSQTAAKSAEVAGADDDADAADKRERRREAAAAAPSEIALLRNYGLGSFEWIRLLAADRSLMLPLYQPYRFEWMGIFPLTVIFKLALVLPIVFAKDHSLTQLVAVSVLECVYLLFWLVTNPHAEHWIAFLTHVGGVHQICQLCLMAFHRAASFEDRSSSEKYIAGMQAAFIIYLILVAIIVATTIIVPIVSQLVVPDPVSGASRRLAALSARHRRLAAVYSEFPETADGWRQGAWAREVMRLYPRMPHADRLRRYIEEQLREACSRAGEGGGGGRAATAADVPSSFYYGDGAAFLFTGEAEGDAAANAAAAAAKAAAREKVTSKMGGLEKPNALPPRFPYPLGTSSLATLTLDLAVIDAVIEHGRQHSGLPFSKTRQKRYAILAESSAYMTTLERAVRSEERFVSEVLHLLHDAGWVEEMFETYLSRCVDAVRCFAHLTGGTYEDVRARQQVFVAHMASEKQQQKQKQARQGEEGAMAGGGPIAAVIDDGTNNPLNLKANPLKPPLSNAFKEANERSEEEAEGGDVGGADAEMGMVVTAGGSADGNDGRTTRLSHPQRRKPKMLCASHITYVAPMSGREHPTLVRILMRGLPTAFALLTEAYPLGPTFHTEHPIVNCPNTALMTGLLLEAVPLALDFGDPSVATAATNATNADASALNKGRTMLHHAAANGHAEMAKLLIANGASLSKTDDGRGPADDHTYGGGSGQCPYALDALTIACNNGHDSIVRLLLEAGADAGRVAVAGGPSPLIAAADFGHLLVVNTLLTDGGLSPQLNDNHNHNVDYRADNLRCRSALHFAAQNGHLGVVNALLAAGANPNIEDLYLQTPLDLAAAVGHLPVVRRLLSIRHESPSSFIRIERLNGYNAKSAYYFAAEYGHAEVVKELLAAGTRANVWDDAMRTPLHWAAANGHAAVVEALLSFVPPPAPPPPRAEVEETSAAPYATTDTRPTAPLGNGPVRYVNDTHQRKPLHYAAMNGCAAVVSILLESGHVQLESLSEADCVREGFRQPVHRTTPMEYAERSGCAETLRVMKEWEEKEAAKLGLLRGGEEKKRGEEEKTANNQGAVRPPTVTAGPPQATLLKTPSPACCVPSSSSPATTKKEAQYAESTTTLLPMATILPAVEFATTNQLSAKRMLPYHYAILTEYLSGSSVSLSDLHYCPSSSSFSSSSPAPCGSLLLWAALFGFQHVEQLVTISSVAAPTLLSSNAATVSIAATEGEAVVGKANEAAHHPSSVFSLPSSSPIAGATVASSPAAPSAAAKELPKTSSGTASNTNAALFRHVAVCIESALSRHYLSTARQLCELYRRGEEEEEKEKEEGRGGGATGIINTNGPTPVLRQMRGLALGRSGDGTCAKGALLSPPPLSSTSSAVVVPMPSVSPSSLVHSPALMAILLSAPKATFNNAVRLLLSLIEAAEEEEEEDGENATRRGECGCEPATATTAPTNNITVVQPFRLPRAPPPPSSSSVCAAAAPSAVLSSPPPLWLQCRRSASDATFPNYTVLHMAAAHGDVPSLELLLRHVQQRRCSGCGAKLHYRPMHNKNNKNNNNNSAGDDDKGPAATSHTNAVVGVNATAGNGTTALHIAVEQRSEAMVMMLIKAGADVTIADGRREKETALHIAAKQGSVPMVRMLLDAVELVGAGDDGGGLARGAEGEDQPTSNDPLLLLQQQQQQQQQKARRQQRRLEFVKFPSANFGSALFCAAAAGRLDVVRLFVEEEGADVNALRSAGSNGANVLHMACEKRMVAMARYLIEELPSSGSNSVSAPVTLVSHQMASPSSPLVPPAGGCEQRRRQAIDLNATNDSGATALHIAALNGADAIIKMLLATARCDVYAKHPAGHTALGLAEMRGYASTTKLLSEYMEAHPPADGGAQ